MIKPPRNFSFGESIFSSSSFLQVYLSERMQLSYIMKQNHSLGNAHRHLNWWTKSVNFKMLNSLDFSRNEIGSTAWKFFRKTIRSIETLTIDIIKPVLTMHCRDFLLVSYKSNCLTIFLFIRFLFRECYPSLNSGCMNQFILMILK